MSTIDEDLLWLRELHNKLWVLEKARSRHNGAINLRKMWTERRGERVTEQEFTKLLEIVLRWDLPTQMCSTSYGFGVGLVVHEPEQPPIYPGAESETKPEVLAVISQEHLPLSMSTFDPPDRITFDDGFRVFSEVTHSDRNKELLRRCGFEEPQPKGFYDY